LDRVFRRALAKSPDDRPVSALAFAHELRAAASTRPTSQDPAAADALLPRPRRRSSLILAGIAVASLGAFFGHRMIRSSERAAPPVTATTATPPPAPATVAAAKPTAAA